MKTFIAPSLLRERISAETRQAPRTCQLGSVIRFVTLTIGALLIVTLMTACSSTDSDTSVDPTVVSTPDALVPINTWQDGGVFLQFNRTLCEGFTPSGSTQVPCFYKFAIDLDSTPGANLLVLDSATLELVSNEGFTGSQLSELNTALLDVKNGQLAILNSTGVEIGTQVTEAGLENIGFADTSPGDKALTILGYGGAYCDQSKSEGCGQAALGFRSLVGFLRQAAIVKGGLIDLSFVFQDPFVKTFSTRSVPLGSGSVNTVTYGTQTLKSPPLDPGGGAVQLVTFDTKKIIFFSSWQSTYSIQWGEIVGAMQDIIDQNQGAMLIAFGPYNENGVDNDQFNELLGILEKMGVNPDVFARSVKANANYSMISVGGVGYQSSALMATFAGQDCKDGSSNLQACNGALTGLIQRGPNSLLPTEVSPKGSDLTPAENPRLTQILYQAQVPWPLTQSQVGGQSNGAQIALAWLAKNTQDIDPDTTLFSSTQSANLCGTGKAGREVTATNGTSSSYVCDANLRQVALDLRSAYTNPDQYFATVSDAQPWQSSYPFTGCTNIANCESSELAAAINQVNAELLARKRTIGFFDFLKKPFVDDQGAVNATLQDIAESIVADGLKQASAALIPNSSEWVAGMVSSAALAIASVTGLVEGVTVLEDLTMFLNLAGASGASISTALGGAPGMSAAAEYLLLEAQLEETAIEVDSQIEFALLQQALGIDNAEVIVLSDWDKMNTVATNWISGPWALSGSAVEDMEDSMINAYTISVRQQAYYAYMSQLYQVAVAQYVQDNTTIPDSADTWYCNCPYGYEDDTGTFGSVYPFVANANVSGGNNHDYSFPNAGTGGVGDGQLYLPLLMGSIWDSATSQPPKNLVVFNFSTNWSGDPATNGKQKEKSGLHGNGYQNTIGLSLMQNITTSPTDFTSSSDLNAGFYPPTFWFEAFSMKGFTCYPVDDNTNKVRLSDDVTLYEWLSSAGE